MPTIADLKQSKYLTKADVTPPILVTINGYKLANVAMEGQPEEKKWLLTFLDNDKPMVLNSINGEIIAAFTGSEDFDGWIGKKIVLYVDPNVQMSGRIVGGIRCRAPKIPAAAPAPVTPAVTKPAPTPTPAETTKAPESDDVPF